MLQKLEFIKKNKLNMKKTAITSNGQFGQNNSRREVRNIGLKDLILPNYLGYIGAKLSREKLDPANNL